MKILVAFEESQEVTKAFRNLGFEAYSCDMQESSGNHPEWHIQGDAIKEAYSGKYTLMVAHPPCTRLTRRAQYWNVKNSLQVEKEQAIEFFITLSNAPIKYKAIENPIGIMNSKYSKPTQIIQPFEYGDPEQKATCLWLTGLPKLKPTKIVEPKYHVSKTGRKYFFNDKIWDKKLRAKLRSKTFPGIAKAMAEQWGAILTAGTAESVDKKLITTSMQLNLFTSDELRH